MERTDSQQHAERVLFKLMERRLMEHWETQFDDWCGVLRRFCESDERRERSICGSE
jgi:hypothetical protein